MPELPPELIEWMDAHDWIYTLYAIVIVLLASWVANFITKRILVRGIDKLIDSKLTRPGMLQGRAFIRRLANVIPALVITFGVRLIPDMPEAAVTVVLNVANTFIVLTLALALSGLLDLGNDIYSRRSGADDVRPIKGYLQIVKIVIYLIAALLMIATLLDRSPLILLSGLGALAAVLMLVFQDTLLSLVASIQISSNDLIRLGDWIEMPKLNADGDVIDIALHTVKVQNWDKTITTIPTKLFLSDSFKNWRGMKDAGGRRIKRSIYLDQNTVNFLSNEQKEHLTRFSLLTDYLKDKQKEIDDWNAELKDAGELPANTRRITNIGTLRAYVVNYLKAHPKLRKDMTLMVRQLSPGPEGLPLEVYCFTDTTAWVDYEGIQSDLFDHLLSILPEFGLSVFQVPSGKDMRMSFTSLAEQQDERRKVPDESVLDDSAADEGRAEADTEDETEQEQEKEQEKKTKQKTVKKSSVRQKKTQSDEREEDDSGSESGDN
ncbi:mechanosensitive ion channel protein MscS [Pseudohongiella nitratireducens]|uniref:Mechanosensing system component YbdG n=1 Tax=Pseudohongiella nitratireducens TaxID=1768907 RepID=A0A917GLL5_9GAMM|nr:mechanosensitive ion channel domain-containing protein [Pseudohongiella nitratireducens]GGG50256.1 mechanosensitive ion channel protein MscS [Pseudohongiella nitratireducens]